MNKFVLSAALLLAVMGSASAQQVKVVPPGPPIAIEAGQGTLLQTNSPVASVFVADHDVVDVHMAATSPDHVFVFAKKPGTTMVYGLDEEGKVVMSATVTIPNHVREVRVMRGSHVTVYRSNDPSSGGGGTDISELPKGSYVIAPVGGR